MEYDCSEEAAALPTPSFRSFLFKTTNCSRVVTSPLSPSFSPRHHVWYGSFTYCSQEANIERNVNSKGKQNSTL